MARFETSADRETASSIAPVTQTIEGSWTTAGLWRSMNSLFESFTRQADKILTFASETRNFVDKVYQDFQEKYGFDASDA